jgi:CheY-like chemotaxis protein
MSLRNILHVDDSADDLLLVRAACQYARVSFGLQSVEGGEKAIAYLTGEGIYSDRARHPVPDLILLDLKMPLKSGYEVLAWIRNQPHFKTTPVIIFTGGAKESDIERVYQMGADEFLAKTGLLTELNKIALALESVFARGDLDLKPLHLLCAQPRP